MEEEVHKTKPKPLEEPEQRPKSLFKILHGLEHRAVSNIKVRLCWRYESCHVK
jgi:hypothetical protein